MNIQGWELQEWCLDENVGIDQRLGIPFSPLCPGFDPWQTPPQCVPPSVLRAGGSLSSSPLGRCKKTKKESDVWSNKRVPQHQDSKKWIVLQACRSVADGFEMLLLFVWMMPLILWRQPRKARPSNILRLERHFLFAESQYINLIHLQCIVRTVIFFEKKLVLNSQQHNQSDVKEFSAQGTSPKINISESLLVSSLP